MLLKFYQDLKKQKKNLYIIKNGIIKHKDNLGNEYIRKISQGKNMSSTANHSTDNDDNMLLFVGVSRIKAEGTRNSYWVKNINYDKNWTLEKREFGEPIKIYGWFEEVSFGEKKGKLKVVVPQLSDEDGNDCRIIGYFDDEVTCMSIILQENHPDYGGIFI